MLVGGEGGGRGGAAVAVVFELIWLGLAMLGHGSRLELMRRLMDLWGAGGAISVSVRGAAVVFVVVVVVVVVAVDAEVDGPTDAGPGIDGSVTKYDCAEPDRTGSGRIWIGFA